MSNRDESVLITSSGKTNQKEQNKRKTKGNVPESSKSKSKDKSEKAKCIANGNCFLCGKDGY